MTSRSCDLSGRFCRDVLVVALLSQHSLELAISSGPLPAVPVGSGHSGLLAGLVMGHSGLLAGSFVGSCGAMDGDSGSDPIDLATVGLVLILLIILIILVILASGVGWLGGLEIRPVLMC